ncbi:hypothetical protein CcI6DRAFT_02587 [Frankia sp. CcI6]|uniref:hypothetical protein n=1 Tax=Frankia TaxID=1854 RepID=UPI0003D03028|nr:MULTISPECIES: hypothetical protein [Frankia]ETA01902.1 hypothetical protein CcI6DRAFT_02587 [Frankia sp. CcI6]KFB05493.1 hypothetical protein ALLO2DRAFT_01733 [Frankia sp. Allo2]OAA24594.1 hypothetical protein AAY23_10459 [Frankia casuarinae]OFB42673.1 hypothetical protein Manayef4_14335 [Frankia sp. CgIM4]OHV54629.1 hypothetical protein CgIS1_12270 [Frankia sp. CgIS1]
MVPEDPSAPSYDELAALVVTQATALAEALARLAGTEAALERANREIEALRAQTGSDWRHVSRRK